jgi:mRNA interferase RelE/StbE
LPYRTEYTRPALGHLRDLTARQRATVIDEVSQQLPYEPTRETRNRKEMLPNDIASWELRIGDVRVYYDVLEDSQTVLVAAVGIKRGNRVFIGGIERQL